MALSYFLENTYYGLIVARYISTRDRLDYMQSHSSVRLYLRLMNESTLPVGTKDDSRSSMSNSIALFTA